MKVLFHLAHPAHYHLFKNIIAKLDCKGHDVLISYNEKDILGDILKEEISTYSIYKVPAPSLSGSKYSLYVQFILKVIGFLKVAKKHKPDLLVGTSIIIAIVGHLLRIKSIIVNEDDFDIINKTASIGYRFANYILAPDVCRTGKWSNKTVTYPGYHELAYLHPDLFKPDIHIVKRYFDTEKPLFLVRLANLQAHHDEGISGLDNRTVAELIKMMNEYGQVFISSERKIPANLEKHRITINPIDIHHVMAFCNLYIGDSQTMAAEAAVLGTPFIRVNDFVGRISYLDDLENNYKLGYGINPNNRKLLFEVVNKILTTPDIKSEYQNRRKHMLKDKINTADYISSFIDTLLKNEKHGEVLTIKDDR